MSRLIGSTTGFQVNSRGHRVYRSHKHACGHDECRCSLEHFASTTACERCREAQRSGQESA